MSREQEPLSPLEQRMLDGLLRVAGEESVHSGPAKRSRFAWLAVAAVTVLGLGAAATVPSLLEPSIPDTPVQQAPAPGHIGYRKVITGTRYVSTRLLDNRYVDITAEIRGTGELWAELSDPRTVRAKLEPHQVLECAPADQRGLCANWLADTTGKGLGLRLTPEDRTLPDLGRHPESDVTGLSHQTLNLLPANNVGGRPVTELAANPDELSGQFDELSRRAHRKGLQFEPSRWERLRLAVDLLLATGATREQRAAAWTVAQRAAEVAETEAADRLGRPGRALAFETSPGSRRQLVLDPATLTLLSQSEDYPPPKDTERQKFPVAIADYTLYLGAGAVRSMTEVR
ncbi:hypothetical protein M8C13_19920 [Crossiella sp. SN42]|uniref:hypothetical protein n=1 Tax=Crossiella sp. SN42 TaxID=2944808 RepID=UPI00207D0743|nr:hypothetical protein [Crossiella sp. SN42]MCO1578023.1 hypothetical protein [Crossiella sp. SN42]